jgi:hypothetical protein
VIGFLHITVEASCFCLHIMTNIIINNHNNSILSSREISSFLKKI